MEIPPLERRVDRALEQSAFKIQAIDLGLLHITICTGRFDCSFYEAVPANPELTTRLMSAGCLPANMTICGGRTSPSAALSNYTPDERAALGIPAEAASFVFAYPVPTLADRIVEEQDSNAASDANQHKALSNESDGCDGWQIVVSLFKNGGFLFADEHHAVCHACALHVCGHKLCFKPAERVPSGLSTQLGEHLARNQRLEPVNIPDIRGLGAELWCWVVPEEGLLGIESPQNHWPLGVRLKPYFSMRGPAYALTTSIAPLPRDTERVPCLCRPSSSLHNATPRSGVHQSIKWIASYARSRCRRPSVGALRRRHPAKILSK